MLLPSSTSTSDSNTRRIWLLFPLLLSISSCAGAPALPGPPIFEAISHYPSLCYLPPESGLCPPAKKTTEQKSFGANDESAVADRSAGSKVTVEDGGNTVTEGDEEDEMRALPLLTRYYFDPVTAQCYPFGAQTCGGNENRFKTQSECLTKCRIESE